MKEKFWFPKLIRNAVYWSVKEWIFRNKGTMWRNLWVWVSSMWFKRAKRSIMLKSSLKICCSSWITRQTNVFWQKNWEGRSTTTIWRSASTTQKYYLSGTISTMEVRCCCWEKQHLGQWRMNTWCGWFTWRMTLMMTFCRMRWICWDLNDSRFDYSNN